MANSLCFRTINEIKLSEKLNLIGFTDEIATYSDLSNKFAVPTAAVEQILETRNQSEPIDSSTQKRNFVSLETKIKVMNLMMKKKNVCEVGRICKIDCRTAKNFFNPEKLINLRKSGLPMGVRRALYTKFMPINDEVLNFKIYVRL